MTQMRQRSQPGPRGPGPSTVPQSCLLKTRSQALSPKPSVPGHGSSMVMEKTPWSPQLRPPAVGVSAPSPCLGLGRGMWKTGRRDCMGSHPCGSLSPVCAPGRLTPVVTMSLRPPHPVVRSEAGSLSQWPCRTVVPPTVSQAWSPTCSSSPAALCLAHWTFFKARTNRTAEQATRTRDPATC